MVKPDRSSNYTIFSYIKDIAFFVQPYQFKFWLGFIFRLSSDIVNLFPYWALSQIVVLLTAPSLISNNQSRIYLLLIGLVAAYIYYASAHAIAKWFGYQVGERIALDARLRALQHIFSLDISWQEKENTGNKLKRIDHGSASLDSMIRIFFDVIVEATLNSIGMLAIFSAIGLELGLGILVFMIIYFALSFRLTKKGSDQSYLVNKLEEELEGFSFESLNNIKTVKSLSIQSTLMGALETMAQKTYLAIQKRILLFRVRSGVLNVFQLVFKGGMIVYIVSQIMIGRYTTALLILFMGYFSKVEEAISELAEVTHDMVINKVRFHRLKEILKIQPTIEKPLQQQLPMPGDWQQIQLRNITFSYEDKTVIKNFNLTIKRGQKIGIVGLSGAGKSTLFNLLLDLYENFQGEILVDNTSLKDINRQDYIDHLAVVLQDTELFNASLKENILIGGQPHHPIDSLQLNEAIKTANLNEVIAKLPKGAETIIGEKGVKLSGGEKQRLGIARALYRQPDLLLMDEATSHLDVESEKKIQASLKSFFNQVTAVVIAHRLSTIQEMDVILVMQGGKIIESGAFKELIALKGAFAKLWQKQKL